MNLFYNAHHSPIGAFASFTLGFKGAAGGLGLELGKPADHNVYIGVESENGKRLYRSLPFFESAVDESRRYDVEKEADDDAAGPRIYPYSGDDIRRELRLGTDTWEAEDLVFRIYSPRMPFPIRSAPLRRS